VVAACAVVATSASMEVIAALFCEPRSEHGLKMMDMVWAAAVA